MKLPTRHALTVVTAATVLAVVAGGGAVAGSLITSKDIQDKTIRSADIHKNAIKTQKVKNGTLRLGDMSKKVKDAIAEGGPAGPRGPQGPQGPKGDPGSVAYSGANWSIIDRNTEGNGDGFLRAGPSAAAFGAPATKPPRGIGSLGLRTGSATDKIAFGNQVDFAGNPLSGLNTVSYWVFTTGENISKYNENLPGVTMELIPGVPSGGGGSIGYTSLVYTPVQAAAGWSEQDASTAKRWWLTGSAGTASSCNQVTYCTLAEVKAAFPNATIQTVAIAKGKDYAFSGAVDALRINSQVFDFEPFGVSTVAP